MAREDRHASSLPRNLDFTELQAFLAVIAERSFSRAATKMHRTQSAVSYAVRRLEGKVGERLFHRSNNGALTEAGEVLRQYAERLVRLADEAQLSVRELRDLRRGRVLIGANEASIAMLLPLIAGFRARYPQILIDIRRVHARHIGEEVLQGNLEFGVTTFPPRQRRLRAVALGTDELVALVYPSHPFATRDRLRIVEWAREPIIIPNDPSPARERVMQLAEARGTPVNVQVALPTLEAIKLAVAMRLGITLLPRRCAVAEIDSGQLIAVPVTEVQAPHTVHLIYRRAPALSHSGSAFLDSLKDGSGKNPRTAGRRRAGRTSSSAR
jgi:DNA-binding transcriptional LysR family regulator